jgi:cardiolipin synthase
MNLNVNDETLLFDGPSYEPFLLKQIEECTLKIFISCYIIEHDTFGEKVLLALAKKAEEGVKVFLIADGLGSWEWINEHADQYRSENFEIRVYHPMTWKLLGISIKNIFWGVNRRNHHKLLIFDQQKALNGSRNINNNALTWRETSVYIVGPSVSTLCALFHITWQRSHNNLTKRYNFQSTWQAYKKLKRLRAYFIQSQV